MGSSITITNNTDHEIYITLNDEKGGNVDDYCVMLKPGDTKSYKECTLQHGAKYEVICKHFSSSDGQDLKKATFFAPSFTQGLVLQADPDLLDLQMLKDAELQYLTSNIVTGVILSDREAYGIEFKNVFIANELVVYLVLHNIANSRAQAVRMCQKLLEANVFQKAADDYQDFADKFLPFRVNTDHECVRSMCKVVPWEFSRKDINEFRFEGFSAMKNAFCSPRSKAAREIEGWLEKKSRMGFYNPRYFRILPDKDNSKKNLLCYFENVLSIQPACKIPMDKILLVERQRTDKTGRIFIINTVPGETYKKVYTVRAPSQRACYMWIKNLQNFAQTMTPVDFVSRSALASVLDRKAIREFVENATSKKIRKGGWVCRANDVITRVLILTSGEVGLYETSEDGKNYSLITTHRPVRIFGEQLFYKETPHILSCRAQRDCEFLCVKKRDLQLFMQTQGQEVKGRLRALFETGVKKCIEKTIFFKNLTLTQEEKLMRGFTYRWVPANEVLFNEGDPGHHFFIVYSGALDVIQVDTFESKEIHLNKVRSGDVFGEIALMLPGAVRTATVRASEDSLLLALDEKAFKSFLRAANLKLNAMMQERLVYTLKSCEMFSGEVSKASFNQLAQECKVEALDPGEVVFKKGDEGDRFYMIAAGEVEVIVDDRVVKVLGRGNYFGEVALAIDMKRTASCVVKTRALLLSVDKASFRRFIGNNPETVAESELRICREKCQIRSVLYHSKGFAKFSKFMRRIGAYPMLQYWSELCDFRKWACPLEPDQEPCEKEIQRKVEQIFKRFFEAKQSRVDLSEMPLSVREGIEEDIRGNMASPATFIDLETYLVNALAKQHLDAFKVSEEFQELLEELGGYTMSASGRSDNKPKFGAIDRVLLRRATLSKLVKSPEGRK
mmetsp:Transcript_11362/g.15886  ORF Transcript_11362/g.15886 Transcript_11362/m.15886 type:complete len:900 (-) Transcript_11362:903-3602(-)|eukprot:CAMPEP_0184490392 /NCGR_PEP_ID=MMETSP0113_2-20130426/17759_1 /TAXON_ID=91329 /ORGANISM="Norrisiella sphaerica, Strain BC52" /LENGTH=899 /DNA_ID=CAMNT_0026874251 /DNA_START=93 /DNA_END=2792 /DNA_ORIENTATION=-